MIRSELIDKLVGKNPGLAARDIEAIVDCFFEEVVAQLAHGGRVELRGFGTFSTRDRDARTDIAEHRCRFVDGNLMSCTTQRNRGGQSADPGPDDGDFHKPSTPGLSKLRGSTAALTARNRVKSRSRA